MIQEFQLLFLHKFYNLEELTRVRKYNIHYVSKLNVCNTSDKYKWRVTEKKIILIEKHFWNIIKSYNYCTILNFFMAHLLALRAR